MQRIVLFYTDERCEGDEDWINFSGRTDGAPHRAE